MNFFKRTFKRVVPESNDDNDHDYAMPSIVTERVGPVSEFIPSSKESLSPRGISPSEALLTSAAIERVGQAALFSDDGIKPIGNSSGKVLRTDEVIEGARAQTKAATSAAIERVGQAAHFSDDGIKPIGNSSGKVLRTDEVIEGARAQTKAATSAVIERVGEAAHFSDDGIKPIGNSSGKVLRTDEVIEGARAQTKAAKSIDSSSDKHKPSGVSERERPFKEFLEESSDESSHPSEILLSSAAIYPVRRGDLKTPDGVESKGKSSKVDESVNTDEAFMVTNAMTLGGKIDVKVNQNVTNTSDSSAHNVVKNLKVDHGVQEDINRGIPRNENLSPSVINSLQREAEQATSYKVEQKLTNENIIEKHPQIDEGVNTSETFISSDFIKFGGNDNEDNRKVSNINISLNTIDYPNLTSGVEHEASHKLKNNLSEENVNEKNIPADVRATFLSSKAIKIGGANENKVDQKFHNVNEDLKTSNIATKQKVKRSSAHVDVRNRSDDHVVPEAPRHKSLSHIDSPSFLKAVEHEASHKIEKILSNEIVNPKGLPVDESVNTSEAFFTSKVMNLGGKNENKVRQKVSKVDASSTTSDDRINQGVVKRSSAHRVVENRNDDGVIPESIDRDTTRHGSLAQIDIPSIQMGVEHGASHKVDSPVDVSANTSETYISSKDMNYGGKNHQGAVKSSSAYKVVEDRIDDRVIPESINRDTTRQGSLVKHTSTHRFIEQRSDDRGIPEVIKRESLRRSDISSIQTGVEYATSHKVDTPVDVSANTSETFISSNVMKLGGRNENKAFQKVSNADKGLISSADRINQGAVKRSSTQSLRPSGIPSIQRGIDHRISQKVDSPVDISVNTSETYINSKFMKLGGKNNNKDLQKTANADEALTSSDDRNIQGAVKRSSAHSVIGEPIHHDTRLQGSLRPYEIPSIQRGGEHGASHKVDTLVDRSTNTSDIFISSKVIKGASQRIYFPVDLNVSSSQTYICTKDIKLGGKNNNKDFQKISNTNEGSITSDYRNKQSSPHRVVKNRNDDLVVTDSFNRDTPRHESSRSSDISSLQRGIELGAYERAKRKQSEYPSSQEVTELNIPAYKRKNVSNNQDEQSDSRVVPNTLRHENSRLSDIPSLQRGVERAAAERAKRKLSEYSVSQEGIERGTESINVSDNRFNQRMNDHGTPLKVFTILSDNRVVQSTVEGHALKENLSTGDKRNFQEAVGIGSPKRVNMSSNRVNKVAINNDKSGVFQSTAAFKVDKNQNSNFVIRKFIERDKPITRAASTGDNRVTQNIKSANENLNANNILSKPRVRSVSVSVKRVNENLSRSSTVIVRVGPVTDTEKTGDDGITQAVTPDNDSFNFSKRRKDQKLFRPNICLKVGKNRNDGRENRSVNEALYASDLRRRIGVMNEQPCCSDRASPGSTMRDSEGDNCAKEDDVTHSTASEMGTCRKLHWYWAPVFITCWILLYFCISIPAYNNLPTPFNIKDERKHPDAFIAQRAHINLKRLTNHRRRVITKEVAAIDFFKQIIKKLKSEASSNLLIKADVQKSSGTYIHEQMIFMYQDVQSFVVKISTKNSSSNSYLLVKSHYDPVSGEQDNDDVSMMAIMLETLRVLSRSDNLLNHPVVFLFNVASQNPVQGAHAFITTHKWAKNVKALINLDSAGRAGRGLLFQTGPKQPWLMKQYLRAIKHPFSSTVAQEIFQRPFTTSASDKKIFWKYARVPGLHMVYQYNGYGCPEVIPFSALQITGDNLLSMVRAISNAPEMPATSRYTEGNIIYFDVLGTLLISYSETESIILNTVVVITAISAVTVSCYMMASNSGIVLSKIFERGVYLMSVQISAIVVGITSSFFVAHIMEVMLMPMSWLSEPWLILGLYFCPLLFGLAIVPVCFFAQVTDDLLPIGQRVQLLQHCHCLFLALMTLLLTICRIRSAFLFMIALLFYSMGIIINLTTKLYKRPLLWVVPHIICGAPPFIFYAYVCHGCYVTLIPMTGRFGADVNPELFVCALTVGTGLLTAGFLMPLLNLFRKSELIVSSLLLITAIFVLIAATPLGFPYRQNATVQRFSVLHTRRVFHDANKEVRRQESGYLIMPNEKLCSSVEEHALQMPLAQSITADCETEMVCGQPFYNERWHKLSASSLWLSGPVPKFEHLPNLEVIHKTAVHDSSVCYDLLLEGPSHMTLFIRPLKSSRIIAWSFHLTPLRLNWSPPYFLFLSFGTDTAPLNFWLQFEKTSDTDWSDEFFEIGISGHWKQHDHLLTKDAKTLIKSFPKHAHITAWPASYETWVF